MLKPMRLIICLLCVTAQLSVAAEPVRLQLWTHWLGEKPKMQFFKDTVQGFEQRYPQIRVDITWTHKERIRLALHELLPNGQGPDIFYEEPYPFQAQPYVLKGYLLNLKTQLDWQRFEPSSYQLLWEYPDGGIYGIPLEVAEYAIYYNKRIFQKAGITVPATGRFTAAEFLAAVKTLRAQGIIPVAIGNEDSGSSSNMLLQGLLVRFAGAAKIRGFGDQTTSWHDPDIVAALTYMKELIDAGVFPAEMNRLSFKEGRDLFITEQAAMAVEGTWFFGKLADENGQLPPTLATTLGALDYPTVPGGKGNHAVERITGGSLVVRRSSPHTREAVLFLDYLTAPENALKWVQYTQSPTGVKVGFAKQVSQPFLQELFASRGEVAEYVVPGTMFLLTPAEIQVWTRDLGIAFMGGGLSVAEVLDRLADAAEKSP